MRKLAHPRRYTIRDIKRVHVAKAEGRFFSPGNMRFFRDTLGSFSVRHFRDRVYVVHKKRGTVWAFDPNTGELDTVSRVGEVA